MCLNDMTDDVRDKVQQVRGFPMRSARDPIRHLDPRDERALGRLAAEMERAAEHDRQVARTLDATRRRLGMDPDDAPGPCVLCGEAPCVCWTDPDNMRDRELDYGH